MKNALLLFFVFIGIATQGQTTLPENSGLAVQRIYGTQVVRKAFKPAKILRIKTLSGETFQTPYYEVWGDTLILFGGAHGSVSDTISFSDIGSIKGKVISDVPRKVLGVVLIAAGLSTIPITAFIGAWGGGFTAVLYATPSAGVAVTGVTLLGTRKFNTKSKWQILHSNQ